MHRPSLMFIHSILGVGADPCRTCPNHDVGGALQLMKGKKNPIKKQDSIPIPISLTWENLTAHYLTITNYQTLTCARSVNRIVTPKENNNKNQPHAIIYNTVNITPSNGNMEQTSNKFLFSFHHVQLPNKVHRTNCLNAALYPLRAVLSRYTLFYQGELDPSLNREKLKEGILSAINT